MTLARHELTLARHELTLARHEWGDSELPRLVCLHGVTSHGRHFASLADRLTGGFHVVAPDLLGHGDSPSEPPWTLEAHIEAVLATVGREPAVWLGHSFGGRLAFELAAREPALVERLVLLDPAIELAPHVGLWAAEQTRPDRSYASFAEAIERRYAESQLTSAPRELLERELSVHLVESEDGRWRYRFCQSAVIAAYSEMTRRPPPFERVRVPTLLVLGETSYLSYDELIDAHTRALGDLLEVERIPAGHTVLWDALDDTADKVGRFLGCE